MKKVLLLVLLFALPIIAVAQSTSNPADFTVTVPQKVPTITSLSPNTATMNGSPVTMIVTGTNFDPAAKCVWNGTITLTTTFNSSTQLTCIVQTALLTVPTGQSSAKYPVTVANPVTVALTWDASTTVGAKYNVRRDGALLTSNPLASLSFDDTNVPSGTHSWGVTAVASGVESVPATVALTL